MFAGDLATPVVTGKYHSQLLKQNSYSEILGNFLGMSLWSLTLPISDQCSLFIPPKNTRKEVFGFLLFSLDIKWELCAENGLINPFVPRFSDIFRGQRKASLGSNGLKVGYMKTVSQKFIFNNNSFSEHLVKCASNHLHQCIYFNFVLCACTVPLTQLAGG